MTSATTIRPYVMTAGLLAATLAAAARTQTSDTPAVPPVVSCGSVAEIRELSESDFGRNVPFRLSGLVIASDASAFVLETPDGNCHIHTPTNAPSVGEIVVVRGHTKLDCFDKVPILRATDWTSVARGKVSAPVTVSLDDLLSGRLDCWRVRTEGLVANVCNDEVDSNWCYLVLNANGRQLPVACPKSYHELPHLLNARIAVVGICSVRKSGKRRFLGPMLTAAPHDAIQILAPASGDPFAVPPLGDLRQASPEEIVRLGRRAVRGSVLAILKDEILIRSASDNVLDVKLVNGEAPPRLGDDVCVAGIPETDLYNINLAAARVKVLGRSAHPDEPPRDISPAALLDDQGGLHRFEPRFHGRPIRLCGISRSAPTEDIPNVNLDCGGRIVPVNVHAIRGDLPEIPLGSRLSVAGICRMDADVWQPNQVFPQIRGFTLIPRTAADIRILARPPWWTPRRLFGAALTTVALVAALFCWSTALTRAKARLRIEERTRLAAELHDWLAQNLTALSYRLLAASHARASGLSEVLRHVEVASAMLGSCRSELRRCLCDLRTDALSEPTFDAAVRKTLAQVADLSLVSVRIDIPRTAVSDPAAHAILSAVRELTANAFRHGRASHVEITGKATGKALTFVVTDDGHGFDPESRPGPDEGHFGLDNIANRIAKSGGKFSIASRPGEGATARITLHLQRT